MRDILRLPVAVSAFGMIGCALATDVRPSVEVTDVRLLGIGLTR